MKITFFLALMLVLGACSQVSEPTAVAVELNTVCSPSMKNKDVVVQGFLQVADKVPCMKALRPKRDCAFKLLDKINVVGNEPLVYLPEGPGANEVQTPESSKNASEMKPSAVFARGDVKFKLNDGTEITPTADIATPVTVTGTIHYSEDGIDKLCGIYARKVEKRQ